MDELSGQSHGLPLSVSDLTNKSIMNVAISAVLIARTIGFGPRIYFETANKRQHQSLNFKANTPLTALGYRTFEVDLASVIWMSSIVYALTLPPTLLYCLR